MGENKLVVVAVVVVVVVVGNNRPKIFDIPIARGYNSVD